MKAPNSSPGPLQFREWSATYKGAETALVVADNAGAYVFVVDQINVLTEEFSGHKVISGFKTLEAARGAYSGAHDSGGSLRLGAITRLTQVEYKNWSEDGDKRVPIASMIPPLSINPIAEGVNGGLSLTIFDIDDTLFHTSAKVRVMAGTQVIATLTSSEFNDYKLKPGESFDFGEFRSADKFRDESEPIRPMLAKLKAILKNTADSTVIMLTARADFDSKATFLQTFKDYGIDMSRIHVHRVGNLPNSGVLTPARKVAVIRQYLQSGKYSSIRDYDDSLANLRAFALLKREYPDVEFKPYIVDKSGGAHLLAFTLSEAGELEESWKSLVVAGIIAAGQIYGDELPADKVSLGSTTQTISRPIKAMSVEMEIVAATLIGEARGEGESGMHAVLNVIMNRAKGNMDDAAKVCLKPWQFSFWNKKEKAINSTITWAKSQSGWKTASDLVIKASKGGLSDISGGATFYFNPKLAMPKWAAMFTQTKVLGHHTFYNHGKVPVSKFI